MRFDQGSIAAALHAFGVCLNTLAWLATAEPANDRWRYALIAAHAKIAGAATADAQPALAAEHYRAALAIVRDLAANNHLDPDATWMIDELERLLAAAEAS